MSKQWSAGTTAKVSFSVNTNENGNIATNGETAAGNTKIEMKGIKSDATLEQSKAVFGAFVEDIIDGTYNEDTGKKTVEYTVVNQE